MIKRHLEDKIRSALATNSSVALMGPRQVGKTTLAINIAILFQLFILILKTELIFRKLRTLKLFTKKTAIN